MTGKKVLIVVGVVLLGAAVVRPICITGVRQASTSRPRRCGTRDLEAIVSASGKVQPKRQVNISANTMGRVTRLAVEEGQRVKAGQFLLEIDPKQLEGQLQRGEASVAAAQSSLLQARTAVEQARANLDLAAEPEAAGGPLEGRTDHARGARARAERGHRSRGGSARA